MSDQRDVLEFRSAATTDRIVREADPKTGELTKAVIKRVKLLGNVSTNLNPDGVTRNVYPLETRKKALPLYEGATVNIDHPPREAPAQARSYNERIGQVRDAVPEEDGTYGDLHLNPHHPSTKRLLWDAEHAPGNLGMSHNARWGTSRVIGKDCLIESIELVRSIDVVTKPATTRGLFESAQEDPVSGGTTTTTTTKKVTTPPAAAPAAAAPAAAVPAPATVEAAVAPAAADTTELLAVLDDPALDDAAKIEKLRELIAAGAPAGAVMAGATEGRHEAAPGNDLLEIRREIAALRAERSGDQVERLILESGLEPAAITPLFRSTLAGQSEARVRELLEDRRAFAGRAPSSRPTSRDPGRQGAPVGAPALTPVQQFFANRKKVT